MSAHGDGDAAPARAPGRVRFETLWLLIPAATLLAIALLGSPGRSGISVGPEYSVVIR